MTLLTKAKLSKIKTQEIMKINFSRKTKMSMKGISKPEMSTKTTLKVAGVVTAHAQMDSFT